MSEPRLAILGAGPVGLDAALAARASGMAFTVYEASSSVAANVRAWGHVKLFTPWSMNVSPRARVALADVGAPPAGDDCPTGAELVEKVLEPISALPDVAANLVLGTEVLEIGRDGLLKSDEVGTGARKGRRFRLLLRDSSGTESVDTTDIVLDCTGTYHNPNALGAGGICAPGERSLGEYITRRIPDFEAPQFTGDAQGWSGQRILLVGAGHSAQTVARALAGLVERVPGTNVVWVIRSSAPTFGAVENDALPDRFALSVRAHRLAGEPSPFDVRLGRSVGALQASPGGVIVTLVGGGVEEEMVVVDRIISLTGSVGEAGLYRQLQVHECWATSGPMKLAAALMSSSSADCLDQESHGAEALMNPEPDFFILGSKSYGRNTTFLLRTGWEQVDDVFTRLQSI